ncbi:MAG: DUF2141 domain-containing protein [Pseudomonadota bacterium]
MKTAIATVVSLMVSLALSTVAHAASLTITVTDIEEPEGFLMIAIFDVADAYDNGGEAYDGLRIPVDAAEVSTTIEDLPEGQYAIKLYHDANGNGEMDTNMMGLPVEGYGFSSNKGRFGPPPFADAMFEVSEDADNQVVIKLR